MENFQKDRSRVQEDVVRLYLRLNGFFVSGFISHSPIFGRVLTEIDALGIRMPYNAEPERMIATDPVLGIAGNVTDLVICEAKSRGQQLRFNDALSTNADACASVLRWAGVFSEEELPAVVSGIQAILSKSPLPSDCPPTIVGPRGIRVHCLLFSLERNPRRVNQPWFVSGSEAFAYIFDCLCPAELRSSCATQYDFTQWREFSPIVSYFKSRADAGDIQELYAALGCSSATAGK